MKVPGGDPLLTQHCYRSVSKPFEPQQGIPKFICNMRMLVQYAMVYGKSLLFLYPQDVFHSEQPPLGKRSYCSCTPSRICALTLNFCMLHASQHSQASLLVVTVLSGMLPVVAAPPVLACESSWCTCPCSQETPEQLHFLCFCPSMNNSQLYL